MKFCLQASNWDSRTINKHPPNITYPQWHTRRTLIILWKKKYCLMYLLLLLFFGCTSSATLLSVYHFLSHVIVSKINSRTLVFCIGLAFFGPVTFHVGADIHKTLREKNRKENSLWGKIYMKKCILSKKCFSILRKISFV